MAGAGIEMSSNWSRQLARFGEGNRIARQIMEQEVVTAAGQGRQEALRLLDHFVYQAPEPTSSRTGRGRSGRTRQAVKIRGSSFAGAMVTAGVYVDPAVANRNGFFYPFILNRGRTDVHYAARPFWTQMIALMRPRRRAQGLLALAQIKLAFARR
jgi:hypothetical protein